MSILSNSRKIKQMLEQMGQNAGAAEAEPSGSTRDREMVVPAVVKEVVDQNPADRREDHRQGEPRPPAPPSPSLKPFHELKAEGGENPIAQPAKAVPAALDPGERPETLAGLSWPEILILAQDGRLEQREKEWVQRKAGFLLPHRERTSDDWMK